MPEEAEKIQELSRWRIRELVEVRSQLRTAKKRIQELTEQIDKQDKDLKRLEKWWDKEDQCVKLVCRSLLPVGSPKEREACVLEVKSLLEEE